MNFSEITFFSNYLIFRSTSRYADLEKPKKKKTLSATTSLVSIPNTIKLSMLNSGLLSFGKFFFLLKKLIENCIPNTSKYVNPTVLSIEIFFSTYISYFICCFVYSVKKQRLYSLYNSIYYSIIFRNLIFQITLVFIILVIIFILIILLICTKTANKETLSRYRFPAYYNKIMEWIK